jgi:CheY-like chemotaxis protein
MPVTPINLLIVDNDPAMCGLFFRIFTGLGHHVRCARSNFLALHHLQQHIPQIILTDLHLPETPGIEEMCVVRYRDPDIHVIATSRASAEARLQSGFPSAPLDSQNINLAYLINMINLGTLPGQPNRGLGEPIWIAPQTTSAKAPDGTLIHCPECLQPSPLTIMNEDSLIHQSCCIHCLAVLYFILVHPAHCAIPIAPYQASRIAALNSRSLTASPMPSAAGTGQTMTVAPRASSSRRPANNLAASAAVSVHSPQR